MDALMKAARRQSITFLTFACVLTLLEPIPIHGANLTEELILRSLDEGLGIAHYSDVGQVQVFYFDKARTRRNLPVPGVYGLYDIEPLHQALLASTKSVLQALSDRGGEIGAFALLSLDGQMIAKVGLPTWPRLAVVSPKLDLIAALFVVQETHRASLRYGRLDWRESHEIYSMDLDDNPEDVHLERYRAENFSWSPDQNFIAYSMKQRLYTFDLATTKSEYIGEGSDPCWSPDGVSIAFRSSRRELVLYNLHDRQAHVLTKNMTIVGFPKWSPDSKYILFTQFNRQLANRDPLTMPSTEFMVLRVGDQATIPIYTPPMGMSNERFYWIKTGSFDRRR